ncbi:unnamed protein product, partial [Linum tenue]
MMVGFFINTKQGVQSLTIMKGRKKPAEPRSKKGGEPTQAQNRKVPNPVQNNWTSPPPSTLTTTSPITRERLPFTSSTVESKPAATSLPTLGQTPRSTR